MAEAVVEGDAEDEGGVELFAGAIGSAGGGGRRAAMVVVFWVDLVEGLK